MDHGLSLHSDVLHITLPEGTEARKVVVNGVEFVGAKTGIWIPIEKGEHGYSAGDFRCSVCQKPNRCYSLTQFCANCGAKMGGEEDG